MLNLSRPSLRSWVTGEVKRALANSADCSISPIRLEAAWENPEIRNSRSLILNCLSQVPSGKIRVNSSRTSVAFTDFCLRVTRNWLSSTNRSISRRRSMAAPASALALASAAEKACISRCCASSGRYTATAISATATAARNSERPPTRRPPLTPSSAGKRLMPSDASSPPPSSPPISTTSGTTPQAAARSHLSSITLRGTVTSSTSMRPVSASRVRTR